MSTGLGLSEFLLSLLLSEGTMIAAAVILLVCIVVFVGCKKHRILRIVCAVLGLCCAVYLVLMGLMVYFSGAAAAHHRQSL